MEAKTTCRICGAEILQATANSTDNRCMPCWKDPGRIERMEKAAKEYAETRERLKREKKLCRTLADTPSNDPYSIVSEFTSLLYFDGLDQVSVDEILEVLHSLGEVAAPKCRDSLHNLLDLIEEGCSPEGFFDPELVEGFLMDNDLNAYELSYQKANEEEDPKAQFEALFAD